MRESRTYGSGRGARGNSRPYRESLLPLLADFVAKVGCSESLGDLVARRWRPTFNCDPAVGGDRHALDHQGVYS